MIISVSSESIWRTKRSAIFVKRMNKTNATNQGMDTPGMNRRKLLLSQKRVCVTGGHKKEHVIKVTNVLSPLLTLTRTNPKEADEVVLETKARDDPPPKEEAKVPAKALAKAAQERAQVGPHHLAVAPPPRAKALEKAAAENPPVDEHHRQGGIPAASLQGGAAAALTVVDHKRKQSPTCLWERLPQASLIDNHANSIELENAPKDTNVITGTRAPVTIGKKVNVLERIVSFAIATLKRAPLRPVSTSPKPSRRRRKAKPNLLLTKGT
jgi:hypothetical protein